MSTDAAGTRSSLSHSLSLSHPYPLSSSSYSSSSHVPISLSEKEAELLQKKLDYFNACLSHLGDTLPSYFAKQGGDDHYHMCKLLRTIASLETNHPPLQNAFYICAEKYENIHRERAIYESCRRYCTEALAAARDQMLAPLQVRYRQTDR